MHPKPLVLVFLMVGSITIATPAFAAAPPPDGIPGGLVLRTGAAERFLAIPRVATHIQIRVSGPVARTMVKQEFHNPSPYWVEGRYVFPLPDDAAVDRMRAVIDGRVIEGTIQEKQQARETYAAARAAGQGAGLVERKRPNVFALSVANIGPGNQVDIEIGYQNLVTRDGDLLEVRVPLVVAPRYHPMADATRAGNATFGPGERAIGGQPPVHTPVRPADWGLGNPVVFDIVLDPGYAITDITSASHDIAGVEPADDGTVRVRLSGDAVPADRDFVLSWRAAPRAAPEVAVFSETVAGETYLLITAQPPTMLDHPKAPRPRELILVIDTSGSMQGSSIRQARRALKLALSRLTPEDRFNLIRFDNNTVALFPEPVAATPAMIRRAQDHVGFLDAAGGTEIVPALAAALSGAPPPGYLRQVVFITDGAVGNDAGFLQLLQDRIGGSRLFMVGIGSAPNGWLMRKAAELGRGDHIFIAGTAEIEQRMSSLFRKLEQPAITGIRIAWPSDAAVDQYPTVAPDLYAGAALSLAARLETDEGTVTLTGQTAAGAWRKTIDLATARPAPGIGKLWAGRKIEALEDSQRRGADRIAVRRGIIEAAVAHRLATQFTSFVAVAETPVRPRDEALLPRDIPSNLPAGWQRDETAQSPATRLNAQRLFQPATARVQPAVPMPRTATPAALKALVGLGLLVLAGVLVVLARRLPRGRLDGLGEGR